jgi:hypothetical protein
MSDSGDSSGSQPTGNSPGGGGGSNPPSGGGEKPGGGSIFPRPKMETVTADRKPASTKRGNRRKGE